MKLKNNGEIWRPIKGFEKLYEISSLGRVKSLARPMHLPNKGEYYTSREKIMSPARIGAEVIGNIHEKATLKEVKNNGKRT